jgi:hypothetical protein
MLLYKNVRETLEVEKIIKKIIVFVRLRVLASVCLTKDIHHIDPLQSLSSTLLGFHSVLLGNWCN